ncbi:hypothetical protein [Vibrio superstes]|uniref:Uncharacterized protein n=1 Tax=Vibrio superstes NBRC 103154 TaxID=1219062 RepID=A0A511QN58_9VIBR|nr:hypothetical protein [Vibrio superstes]GEM78764.1 hypothetical protein VSU01S_10090 [Vibrio superstes NBRC 103154]
MSVDTQSVENITPEVVVNSPSLVSLLIVLAILTALFTFLAFKRKWEDVELKKIDIWWLSFAALALISQASGLRVLNSELDLKLAESNKKHAVMSYKRTVRSTENLSCHSIDEKDKPLCTRIASLAPLADQSNFPDDIKLTILLRDLDTNPPTIKNSNLKAKVEKIRSAYKRLGDRNKELKEWQEIRKLTATEFMYVNLTPWLFIVALSLRLAKAFKEVSLAKSKRNNKTEADNSEGEDSYIQNPTQTTYRAQTFLGNQLPKGSLNISITINDLPTKYT